MEATIRGVEGADAKAIRNIYAPFVTDSATSFEAEPPDVMTMEGRIREQRDRFPWLVYEAGGEVLGYAYASPHRAARKAYQWCVEVSIYLDARMRRRGLGKALYGALFDLLRRQGYINAYAGITLPNEGSRRLHESLGFLPVGVYPRIGFKSGKWHDVVWLQLRLQEPGVPVPELLPAKDLLAEDSIRSLLRTYALRVG